MLEGTIDCAVNRGVVVAGFGGVKLGVCHCMPHF